MGSGWNLRLARGDKPPGLSVEQSQWAKRQPCGAIRWLFSRDRPEAYPTGPWRQTFWFVGGLRPPHIQRVVPGSTARMALAVNGLQSRMFHVRVDLRGGNAGMSQQLLQGPQLGPPGQQVGRKAVP